MIVQFNQNILLEGRKSTCIKAIEILKTLHLYGIEERDRLILQECIDDNNLGSINISYNGIIVFSCDKISTEFLYLKKTNNLKKMSNRFCRFLNDVCGLGDENANRTFYLKEYGSFSKILEGLKTIVVPSWQTDVQSIVLVCGFGNIRQ